MKMCDLNLSNKLRMNDTRVFYINCKDIPLERREDYIEKSKNILQKRFDTSQTIFVATTQRETGWQ